MPPQLDGAPRPRGGATERAAVAITFANIDWKRSRHDSPSSEARNLLLLAGTVRSIVKAQDPSVLCLLEVGEAGAGMLEGQIELILEAVRAAWGGAALIAGDAAQLPAEAPLGEAYITLWRADRVCCSRFSIASLRENTEPERRAQHFVCAPVPPAEGATEHLAAVGPEIDVINVHSPSSGKRKLKDPKRFRILRTLLDQCSKAAAGAAPGVAPERAAADGVATEYPAGTVGVRGCIVGRARTRRDQGTRP